MPNLNTFNDKNLIISLMKNNMRDKFSYVPIQHPNMDVFNIENSLIIDSGLPSDTFNIAFDGNVNLKTATSIFNYYQKKHYPMAWWINENDKNTQSNQDLLSAGFQLDETDVGMVADLLTLPNFSVDFNFPQELQIKLCESEQDFNDFGEVLSSIFYPDPEEKQVKKYYQELHIVPSSQRQNLKLFVGYINNKPVCTSSLFLSDCAGIYDIATKPHERNKGYGTAIFYHALQYAKNTKYAKSLKHPIAVLQASPSGLNIYKRLGFTEITNFEVWSNKNNYKSFCYSKPPLVDIG